MFEIEELSPSGSVGTAAPAMDGNRGNNTFTNFLRSLPGLFNRTLYYRLRSKSMVIATEMTFHRRDVYKGVSYPGAPEFFIVAALSGIIEYFVRFKEVLEEKVQDRKKNRLEG